MGAESGWNGSLSILVLILSPKTSDFGWDEAPACSLVRVTVAAGTYGVGQTFTDFFQFTTDGPPANGWMQMHLLGEAGFPMYGDDTRNYSGQ